MDRVAEVFQNGSAGIRPVRRLTYWCAAAVCALGCGEDGTAGSSAAAGGSGTAIAAGRGGSSADSTETGDADAGTPADAFWIAVSTSTCKGGCPSYDLKLDQNGAVEFNGRGNTRQQGFANKRVSPDTAAEVLQALRAASYWQLDDAYLSTSDGCAQVAADRATYIWNVMADGQVKVVVDDLGCTGLPKLEPLRDVTTLLRQKLRLESWIGF